MPTSYLALKPAPNPALPNWLMWTKDGFSKISIQPSQVAALVGINKNLKLVMLYKPIPIIAPNGSLSAIIGNLNDKKSEPAFIKIDGANVGLAHAKSKTLTRSLPRFVLKFPSLLSSSQIRYG